MIRHASLSTLTILPLPVTMIEPPFRTLLMSAVGATPLTQARLSTAGDAAIALPVGGGLTRNDASWHLRTSLSLVT